MRLSTVILIRGITFCHYIVMSEGAPVTQDLETAWTEHKVHKAMTFPFSVKIKLFMSLNYYYSRLNSNLVTIPLKMKPTGRVSLPRLMRRLPNTTAIPLPLMKWVTTSSLPWYYTIHQFHNFTLHSILSSFHRTKRKRSLI